MSGGAWDCKYPQFADDDEITQHIDVLRLMAHFCRDHNKTTAAKEIDEFVNHLVKSKKEISIKFDRVKDLIHSIDYVAAGDCSFDTIDESVEKITANVNKTNNQQSERARTRKGDSTDNISNPPMPESSLAINGDGNSAGSESVQKASEDSE